MGSEQCSENKWQAKKNGISRKSQKHKKCTKKKYWQEKEDQLVRRLQFLRQAVSSIVIAPAKTGNESNNETAVISIFA